MPRAATASPRKPVSRDRTAAGTTAEIIRQLQLEPEIERLRDAIRRWNQAADEEVRPELTWQFQGGAKYFRPLTIFSCHRAMSREPISDRMIQTALVLEMFHNVSLIVDDIVDRSPARRGKATLHTKFGELQALMVSGYVVADGYDLLAEGIVRDPKAVRYDLSLFSELMKRLAVAECMQWRLRRKPLGVEDWRRIAQEDTGSMFEVCACLGGRSEHLRVFGRLLGMLYHGCDDVGDVRGLMALGGGGEEDLRDGILTLPAALAIRDPKVRDLFCRDDLTRRDLKRLAVAYESQLEAAEAVLDDIAAQARAEARSCAREPEPLYAMVEHTRQLSKR